MTLVALLVSGSWTDRGTEGSAAWWKTTSQPRDRVVDALVALDVALDELDVAVEGLEVRAPAGGEVVEDPDAMARRERAAQRGGSR